MKDTKCQVIAQILVKIWIIFQICSQVLQDYQVGTKPHKQKRGQKCQTEKGGSKRSERLGGLLAGLGGEGWRLERQSGEFRELEAAWTQS